MKNLNKMQVKYISNENILIVTTTSTLAPSPIPSPLFSSPLSLFVMFVNLFPCYPRILMELKSHTQIFPDNNNNTNNGKKFKYAPRSFGWRQCRCQQLQLQLQRPRRSEL